MKKTISLLLCLLVLAGVLSGCGSGTTAAPSTASPAASTEPSAAGSSEEPVAESGNILVVYFSATGNTKAVAEAIAETLGADLFEITPAEPYTADDLNWSNEDSRVVREHENEDLQNQVELETTEVANWEKYETVFFGYPIWWGNAAWPVNQFVRNNDFSGKRSSPSAHPLRPASDRAQQTLRRWREPEPGKKDSALQAARAATKSLHGRRKPSPPEEQKKQQQTIPRGRWKNRFAGDFLH